MERLKFLTSVLLCALLLEVSVAYIESLAANIIIHQSDSTKYEPMVAFLCNKPSMVRVPDGWMHDEQQNCTADVNDILNFCKKKYPDHDITNVVTSHSDVTINNWCKFGSEHCHRHNNHTVRPWRCLVGPFQSSPLLVPEHCVFEHFHNTDICEDENYWNKSSVSRCASRGYTRQSFDILLPCVGKVDSFEGVEYVCCPKPTKPQVSIEVHVEPAHVPPKMIGPNVKERPYFRYMHESVRNTNSEHENYEIARKDMQRYQHDRMTDLMKDWTAARDRAVALKDTDPQKSKTMNEEIGQKFQKMYKALEDDTKSEKMQLNTIHQNHVQRNFNEQKRETMQRYMDELQMDDPRPSKLLDSLLRYMRVEEKDRRHTVNHYEHMRDVNTDEANRIKQVTIDHLVWIDKRILQSLKMLHRFPEIEEDLQPDIERFLSRFRGIEASAKAIMKPDPVIIDEPKEAEEEFKPKPEEPIAIPVVKTSAPTPTPSPTTEVKKPIVEISVQDKVEELEKDDKTFDPETMEDEHKYFDEDQGDFVAHQTNSRLHQDEFSVRRQVVHTSTAYGATIGIAVGSVSVFVFIVVAMVLLKRRKRKPMITHGFVEVDQTISPEERHVANMQINGYENPTYKYFEK